MPTRSTKAPRIRICALVSCRRTSVLEIRRECSAPITANSTAAMASTKKPIRSSLVPAPLDSPEKRNDSSSTETKSAIEAAAITSWPKRVVDSPASWSTGTITPSEVEVRITASSSGSSPMPAKSSAKPAISASTSDAAKPAEAARRSAPRSAPRSISRPARKSRKASPISARTSTGWSISTQPSTAGPRTMPITISSTTEGRRSPGTMPIASGAKKPAATTISRLSNEISIPPPGSRGWPGRYAPGAKASTMRCW